MRVKIQKKPWGSYFAYTKGGLGKNIIDIYSGHLTRRQAGNLAKAERDALQAELSGLKADMFVLNNDLGYTTGVLEDVLKQRDALQARVDALEKKNEINALFEPRKTKEEGYDPNKPVWRDGW